MEHKQGGGVIHPEESVRGLITSPVQTHLETFLCHWHTSHSLGNENPDILSQWLVASLFGLFIFSPHCTIRSKNICRTVVTLTIKYWYTFCYENILQSWALHYLMHTWLSIVSNEQKNDFCSHSFALVLAIRMPEGYFGIYLHLNTETLPLILIFKILLANCEGTLKVNTICLG